MSESTAQPPSMGPADVLWMRPERYPRGPGPALSRAQITAGAVAVADREGADAVTMRRVAAELGCGVMSLYRHVRTKDELLDLMIDSVEGEDDSSHRPAPSGDWRAALHHDAHRLRAGALRHPWLPRLTASRRSIGPRSLARIDSALSVVSDLGLSITEMTLLIQTVHAFVHGFVLNELLDREWTASPGEHDQRAAHRSGTAAYLQQVVAGGRYPHFARMVLEAQDPRDADAAFEWQLQRVLDGLSASVTRA